jgi:hypothetical protein
MSDFGMVRTMDRCPRYRRFLLTRKEGHNRLFGRAARILRKALHVKGLVDKQWLASVERHLQGSGRIRIGFGPLTSLAEDEATIGVRKYRIDPIVDCINASSSKYAAGVFFDSDDMDQYDVLVLVKVFDVFDYAQIAALRRKGKRFVYDIVDNPCNYRPTRVYHDSPAFMRMMDFIIASSPLHYDDMKCIGVPIEMIPHPVINAPSAVTQSRNPEAIRLVWQGYSHNIGAMFSIHPVLQRVAAATGKSVQIVYHTNAPFHRGDCFEIWPWHICDWKHVLDVMDIGVVIKDVGDYYQARKPANKVLSYMAAGLPVVCQPSRADEDVIEEGVNGFKVRRDEDWPQFIGELVEDDGKRKQMSANARRYAIDGFSVEKICQQYEAIFDRMVS